VKSEEAE